MAVAKMAATCVRTKVDTNSPKPVEANGQHVAAVHQRDAIAAGGFVHEVGGYENGYTLFPCHAEQVLPKHIARGGIDAGSGLVQNQHLRAVQAGGGQLQALAYAQGQGAGVASAGSASSNCCNTTSMAARLFAPSW